MNLLEALSHKTELHNTAIQKLERELELKKVNFQRSKVIIGHYADKIQEAFKKMHVKEIRTSIEQNLDEEGRLKAVRVSYSLEPTSKKIRFIKFRGYDSEGRGKNYNKLKEKAEKFATEFEQLVGGEVEAVANLFSFEDNQSASGHYTRKSKNSILLEIWIK